MVFYTDRFIPQRFAGMTYGFVILIRPEYRFDAGLLAHELTHVKQFRRSFGLLPLVALFSKKMKLNLEVEAYREQLKHTPDAWHRAIFADFLVSKYGFKLTHEQAIALLVA